VRVISPIGAYDYRVERITFRDGQLEVAGRLGQWETTMVLDRSDLRNLLGKAAPVMILGGGLWVVTRWLTRV
jgi:hypothetical protein